MTGHPGVLLHAYLDRELSAERSLEIDSHLSQCPRCREELEAAQKVRALLRHHKDPAAPSPKLLLKIHRALGPPPGHPVRWVWGAIAVAAAVGLVMLSRQPAPADDGEAGELVSAHLRSLLAQHLTDVASSDRHTVKPYFQGHLDYAFEVRDFAPQGYPLVGGRLDVLNEQPVAALVYRSSAHVINAFVRPAHGPAQERASRHAGFNLLRFDSGGDTVELVSDASPEVLQGLERAWREAVPQR